MRDQKTSLGRSADKNAQTDADFSESRAGAVPESPASTRQDKGLEEFITGTGLSKLGTPNPMKSVPENGGII